MELTFNTKRLYSDEGQVITAKVDFDTSEVQFNDHTRMISGKFTSSTAAFRKEVWLRSPDLFARMVMFNYDRNRCEWLSFDEAPKRSDRVLTFDL